MIRLCLFGTSHLAALRLAYQAEPERWPTLAITFVGATGSKLLDHQIKNGIMSAGNPALQRSFRVMAGVKTLKLQDYDAFALSGCQIGPHMIGHLYGQARWTSLPSYKNAGLDPTGKLSLMSEAAIDAVLHHRITHSVAGVLGRNLRHSTGAPVLVTSSPRPDAALMKMKKHKLIAQKRAVWQGDASHLSDRYDGLADQCFADMGLSYLAQSSHTIRDHLLTRTIYMEGAIRLTEKETIPQPKDDLMHGNAAYGAAVLDQIIAALSDMKE